MVRLKAPLMSFSASGKIADTVTYRRNNGQNIASMAGFPGSYRKTPATAVQLLRRYVYSIGLLAITYIDKPLKDALAKIGSTKGLTYLNVYMSRFLKAYADGIVPLPFETLTFGGTFSFTSIAYMSHVNRWVAVCSDTSSVRAGYSDDGINWVPATGLDMAYYNDVVYSEELGVVVAVGWNGSTGKIAYSYDGYSYTMASSVPNGRWYSVAYNPIMETWFACANSNATDFVIASPDLNTWFGVGMFLNRGWSTLAVNKKTGFCVMGGFSGGDRWIQWSADGFGWTTATFPDPVRVQDIIYVHDLKMFIGCSRDTTGKNIVYSYDGQTWVTVNTGINQDLNKVIYAPNLGRLFAFPLNATPNNYITSVDGINWEVAGSITDGAVGGAAWSEYRCMMVVGRYPLSSTSMMVTPPFLNDIIAEIN